MGAGKRRLKTVLFHVKHRACQSVSFYRQVNFFGNVGHLAWRKDCLANL